MTAAAGAQDSCVLQDVAPAGSGRQPAGPLSHYKLQSQKDDDVDDLHKPFAVLSSTLVQVQTSNCNGSHQSTPFTLSPIATMMAAELWQLKNWSDTLPNKSRCGGHDDFSSWQRTAASKSLVQKNQTFIHS